MIRLALPPFARRLRRDPAGTAAVEFALILPVMLLAFVGCVELALVIFIANSIESGVFEAARVGITNRVVEGISREEQVRAAVADRTHGLIDMDDVDIEMLVYPSFADVNQPEPFTDTNGNGAHDAGEPFTDVNGNGSWDPDMGRAGLGGAGDVVVYRVTYDWGIATPLIRQVMGESVRNVSSVAVRNEPF